MNKYFYLYDFESLPCKFDNIIALDFWHRKKYCHDAQFFFWRILAQERKGKNVEKNRVS